MAFTGGEVQEAVEAVARETGTVLDTDLAYGVVNSVEEKKNRVAFGAAIRYSLNEHHIKDRHKRHLYAKVVGHVFGSHGNAVQKRMRESGMPTQQRTTPTKQDTPPQTREEPNGQFCFEV